MIERAHIGRVGAGLILLGILSGLLPPQVDAGTNRGAPTRVTVFEVKQLTSANPRGDVEALRYEIRAQITRRQGGRPLAGHAVDLHVQKYGAGRRFMETATTNERGEVRFWVDLEPSDRLIWVSHLGSDQYARSYAYLKNPAFRR